jgi:hypothetical protein
MPLCRISVSRICLCRLADLLVHRVQRVQRCHRLLEDHADLVAADAPQDGRLRADYFLALEADAAVRVTRARVGQQLHHRQRGHRLARTALADQCHGLALVDVDGHAVDRDHFAGRGIEVHRQVLDM